MTIRRRRDAWKEPRYFSVGSVGKDRKIVPALNELLPGNKDEGGFTHSGLLRGCREIIVYRQDDGLYGASFISVSVCAKRKALAYYNFLDAIDMDDESLIETLALCEVYEIPVVPDTVDLAPDLERLFNQLYRSGFKMGGEDGKRKTLKLVKSVGGAPLTLKSLADSDPAARMVQPALALNNQVRIDRFRQLFWHTAQFLEQYAQGIEQLGGALSVPDTDEHQLQKILEGHPELFGLTFQRVTPQFKFAERFVADFVFFTGNGSTIFVEIESPKRRLFTKKGDQTAELTHAIGQVTDWHLWIAQNALYAQKTIPNVESPYSLIVIGRDSGLTESDKTKLIWINSVNRNQFRIITYDELLREASSLFTRLTGSESISGYVESWMNAEGVKRLT